MLVEVLSVVDPPSFGRSMRVHRYIEQITSKLAMQESWRLELAAMMSQLGCVILDYEPLKPSTPARESRRNNRLDLRPTLP